ncbi:hypothetical protein DPMN_001856 [Dreissena polymorpha]|uniref:Uncharacterized protein n=1 Tax=Dreissena polymorpha TaxID=45954 RepID=A0A9D4MMI0_DREPO|nr:hypothetical protein DPMN_001856 [Dreissena polymorpha]
MRGPSGQNKSAKFSSLWGHLLREINRDFRLLLWGYGANTGQLAVPPSATLFTGSGGTETPHCTFGMRGHRAKQSAKFRRSGSPTSEEIIATSGSYYGGNGANTGQLA